MRIELQTAEGEAVRDLDVTNMHPRPEVVRLGAWTYRLHGASDGERLVYRRVFAIDLDGYLPGGAFSVARAERA